MSFLLKIVQGPNAGAEIALPVGITVSLGKGDACDIILSDASLAEHACEFEVTDERIMMLLPDGKQVRMEFYHVQTLGTTAFAVGPGEGAWMPLVWPETRPVAGNDEPEKSVDIPPAPEAPQVTPKAQTHHLIRRLCIGLIIFIFLLLFLVGGAWAVYAFYPETFETGKTYYDKGKAYVLTYVDTAPPKEEIVVEAPKPVTLEELVAQYGLQMEKMRGGTIRLIGDFASRAERLKATAQLYRTQPGVKLDITDEESLTTAIENVLSLVANGDIRLAKLEGRTAYLKGKAASEENLRRILEALNADVPSLVKTDCSAVTLPITTESLRTSAGGRRKGAPATAANAQAAGDAQTTDEDQKTKAQAATPQLPVVGVLTAPYPCLVLRDGSRILEGAHLGDYTVTTITVDGVTFTNANGSFTWRP